MFWGSDVPFARRFGNSNIFDPLGHFSEFLRSDPKMCLLSVIVD
jgi:hypothetical protein